MRRDMSMDVAARFPARAMSRETEEDVTRVQAIWTECRARAASIEGEEAGPFLFGRFSIADAMFAPVVWRFRTYGVALSVGARDYYETMLDLPSMKAWERDAIAEAKALAEAGAAAAAQPNRTPDPRSAKHCFAVIFSNQRKRGGDEAYEAAAAAMVELAARQPGFLGIESARGTDGFGITVSYWDSLEAIRQWKDEPSHAAVQAEGKKSFYERYELRVCNVERGYKFGE
jgi:heme-degrading monooxygenase HmoA